jgi:hypothetical protein
MKREKESHPCTSTNPSHPPIGAVPPTTTMQHFHLIPCTRLLVLHTTPNSQTVVLQYVPIATMPMQNWIGLDWIGLILFRLGHPLSHWLLFRGPSNHKYRINKQTNKQTYYIVNCYYKCQMFNHAMFNSFGGCSGPSSLFSLGGGRGVQRKKARNTITGIGP